MGWAFLYHKNSAVQMLDNEDQNDQISAFSHELDGNLNEQNWMSGILEPVIDGGFADPGLAMRLFSVKHARDPHNAGATGFSVPQFERWTRVDDTKKLFTSRGGKIAVIYSFQCTMTPTAFQTGLNFCIELDGAAMASSLLGTGDQGNDFIDGGGMSLAPGGIVVVFDYGTSPSFRAVQTPHQVYGVFDVEPGEHELWLVTRNLMTIDSSVQFITNRETIVIDGWS